MPSSHTYAIAPRIHQIYSHYKPELVFHAAALKHVPLVEDNPFEGMLTNAMGTRNVADACETADVDVMVMISTDKARNPTNIMGATKSIAQTYLKALDLRHGHRPPARGLSRYGLATFWDPPDRWCHCSKSSWKRAGH